MRYALLCCVVAFVTSPAIASAQSSSQSRYNWTPSRSAMAAAWAAEDRSGLALQTRPDSWEALRDVPPGTKIRALYRDPGRTDADVEANLIEWSPDAIRVGEAEAKRIEKARVRFVWRLEPRPNRGRRVLVGALVGFGLGFALGYSGSPRDAGAAPPPVAGVLVGSLFGGIGGLVRSSRYQAVLLYAAPKTE